MKEKDDKEEIKESNTIIEEGEKNKESKKTIEEGFSQLINSDDTIYCLVDNLDKEKNKLFININLQESPSDDEKVSLYTDSECKNLFQELKPNKGLNINNIFDVSQDQEFYMKSNISKEFNFVSISPYLTLESKITKVALFTLLVKFVKLPLTVLSVKNTAKFVSTICSCSSDSPEE